MQNARRWTKATRKLLCLKVGSDTTELGEKHLLITQTEGILGTMLNMSKLLQTTSFAIRLQDVAWLRFSSSGREPFIWWLLKTWLFRKRR